MKTPPQKSLVIIAAIFGAAGIAGLMLAHAQEASPSGVPTRRINPLAISPELAAELQAVEQLPTVVPSTLPYGGRAGTYYSAQCPYWPPLPGNIFSLPVWNLGDGNYLINDLSIDYDAYDTATTTTATSLMAKPTGDGFSPNDLTQQSGIPFLTIAPTTTNGVYLVTVLNDTGPANYELWWTPVLADSNYPWQQLVVGTSGQTNFFVNITYPTGFYRALWDTNGIPQPSLSITIDSPLNGTVFH
jgi:hypothetical protein